VPQYSAQPGEYATAMGFPMISHRGSMLVVVVMANLDLSNVNAQAVS